MDIVERLSRDIAKLQSKNDQLKTENQMLKQRLKEVIRDMKKFDARLAKASEQSYDIIWNAERGM